MAEPSPACNCNCKTLTKKTPLSLIQKNRNEGCQYCSLIWNSIYDLMGAYDGTVNEMPAEGHIQQEDEHLSISWADGKVDHLLLSTVEHYEGCRAIVRRNRVSTPLSPAFFKLIQSWVEECSGKHSFCRCLTSLASSRTEKLPPPARLIRIDHQEGVYRAALEESPTNVDRYIALSHCWGLKQPLTTTKETLAARKAGIEWVALPRTFQDAVAVCAGLGVNFIWIDSLCILQDDKDDWDTESTKMASIYEDSWLTLAAAAAPDSTHGCFPTTTAIKRYDLQAKGSAPSTSVLARKLRSPIDMREQLLSAHTDLPLFKRGWVLQERLLARRILYLSGDELAYECATNVRCECSGASEEIAQVHEGEALAGIKYRYHSLLSTWSLHRVGLSSLLPFRPTGILNVWDHIVSQFTKRDVTYGSDRLPALAGIAKTMYQTGALGKYHAGLWEARIAEGLLWFIDSTITGLDLLPPGTAPMAPSWSWASINGAWDYRRTSPELESLYEADDTLYVDRNGMELSRVGFACKDFEIELHIKRSDVFGEVELGKISMTAYMTSAQIQYEATYPDENYGTRFVSQKVRLVRNVGSTMMISEAHVDFVLDYGANSIPSGSTVECVGIQPDVKLKGRWHSLVLLPVGDGRGKSYRRVGKFLSAVGWFYGVGAAGLQQVSLI